MYICNEQGKWGTTNEIADHIKIVLGKVHVMSDVSIAMNSNLIAEFGNCPLSLGVNKIIHQIIVEKFDCVKYKVFLLLKPAGDLIYLL